MTCSSRAWVGALLALGGSVACGWAQADEEPSRAWTVFASQRFWAASFEGNFVDAQLGLMPGNPAPVVRTAAGSLTVSDLITISTVGVRVGKFGAFVSILPEVKTAAGDKVLGGSIRRSERDFGLTYQFTPTVSASLIRKTGKFAPLATPQANQLLGAVGNQKGTGTLLGLSANAPLDERLSLFANLGYGPGSFKTAGLVGGTASNKGRYTVAEMGLAYRLAGPGVIPHVGNIAVQLGYRSQIVDFRNVDLPTISTTGTLLANEQVKLRASTQGFAAGLSVAF